MAVSTYVSTTKTRSSFDPVLAQEQFAALTHIMETLGPDAFYRLFIAILRKKDEGVIEAPGAWNGRLVPYAMNRMQADMSRTFGPRNITLKYRQGGATTHHIIDRLYVPTIMQPGTGALLISQTKIYGGMHFAILRRAHRYFGRVNPFMKDMSIASTMKDFHAHVLHTQHSARHELVFDFLESRVVVDTAENEEVGQGLTLHHVVATEVARWPRNPEETLANLKEAIAAGGTVDMESTPNGMGGYFFEEWQRAKQWPQSEFRGHFYPWWWADDYEEETRITPEELTEQEQSIAALACLTLKQVQWRRNKVVSLRHNFAEKYPEDDQSCFLASGRQFFEVSVLRDLKYALETEEPLETHGNGDYQVFHRRVPGRRYLIGADCAEGRLISTDNPDFNSATVMDVDTGQEMASYRSRVPPEDFGYELAAIGAAYNGALMCIERNGPGGSVILTLERQLLYPNMYFHREWFREGGKRKIVPVIGFPTNVKTRPAALNDLATLVREGPELFHDKVFIDEALSFVRDEKGVPHGQEGCHDDTVMARAIAAYCRLVSLNYRDPVRDLSEGYDDGEEEYAE